MFHRNAGTLPLLHEVDERGSGRGACSGERIHGKVRLEYQEAFVWVAAAIGAGAPASEVLWA